MIKLINAFNVQCCMTNKKHWEGRKRTLFFQSDTYRRILLDDLRTLFIILRLTAVQPKFTSPFFTVNCHEYDDGQRTGSHIKSSLSPAWFRCIEVLFNGIAGSQNIVCYTKEFVIYRGLFYIEVSRFTFCIK